METLEAIKIVCLFFGINFTIVNIVRVIRNLNIPSSNFLIQSAGMVGFIYLQWMI